MWSRMAEILLGGWLLISPFVFSHSPEHTARWVNDLASGSLVITFGLLSFWKPTGWAHLLTLGVGCWLIGFAYFQGVGESPPAAQNDLLVGLSLLLFGVIPNQASRPPLSWEEKRLA